MRKSHNAAFKFDRNAGVNQYIRHLDKKTKEALQMKTSQNFYHNPDKQQKTVRNVAGRQSVIVMSKQKVTTA